MAFDPNQPGGVSPQDPTALSAATTEPVRPAPGELGIKEPRSWRTWQLAVAVFATALFGMFLGNLTAGGSGNSGASSKAAYTLPPPASTSSGSTTSTTVVGNTATTTTAAGSASTTTTVPPGHVVLLAPPESNGSWTSTPFTIAGGQWNIGWAFQCAPAPASGPSFEIFVVPAGGTPGAVPAVSEAGGSGQSVTSETSTGSQELEVETGAACVWKVKVTGIP
jgi:hypothetical protein